jgi:L,D-peptidoglycan transpeptidase YkuD (ErfK/YbiS/YcfS/YnhG family)
MIRRTLIATLTVLVALVGLSPAARADNATHLLQLDVGAARQLVVVRGQSWPSSRAIVEAYERTESGWVKVLGPYSARLGRNGFSTSHREGDGTTPAGVFSISEAFGLRPNPGTPLPYRQAGLNDWWVSDAASPFYNTWQVGPPNGWDGRRGERLAFVGRTAYRYAAVIDYNRSPVVAGAGSAIFLHVGGWQATSGCVALAEANLLRILRWLDPAKAPVIAMGPEAWMMSAGAIGGVVRPFTRGDAVRVVQRALARGGYPVAVDGVFGLQTYRAVRAVQLANGLKRTGIVDEATARALNIWAT